MQKEEFITIDVDTSSKEYIHTQSLTVSEAIKALAKDKFIPFRDSYFNVIEVDLFDSKVYLPSLDKPFDTVFRGMFEYITQGLMEYVDNSYFAYTNSDKVYLFYKDTENHKFCRGCLFDISSRVSQKASRLMMQFLTEQLEQNTYSEEKQSVLKQMISEACFYAKVYTMPVSLQFPHAYKIYRALFSGALQNILFQYFTWEELYGKDTFARIDMLSKKGITLSMFEEKHLRGLVFYLDKSEDSCPDNENWCVKSDIFTNIVLQDVLVNSYTEVKNRQACMHERAVLKKAKKNSDADC